MLLLLVATSAEAGEPDPPKAYWEKANDQYARGSYDSAIVLYKVLIEEMNFNAWEVYYNLGNSYYKKGQVAHAILNLERAHRIKPGNKDIKFNLEIANLSQQDKLIEALPENAFQRVWKRITGIMTGNSWTRLALTFFWLSLIGIGLYSFRTGAQQRLGFFGFLTMLGLGLLTVVFAYSKTAQERNDRHAIIMEPSAVIKSEPNDASTNLYLLREGFKLKLLDKVGEWDKVQLADGNVGWVISAHIEEI